MHKPLASRSKAVAALRLPTLYIRKSLLIGLFTLAMQWSVAQPIEPINTDRPDQSDGVYTVSKRSLQLEAGLTAGDAHLLHNLMLRYGLTRSTEARIAIDAGKLNGLTGLMPITFGFKQRLLQSYGLIPSVTFVGGASFGRLASQNFSGSGLEASLKLAMENEFSDRLAVGYNIGTSTWFKSMEATLALAFALSPQVSTFVEYFGSISAVESEHNMDVGILWAIRPNLQVDVAGGRAIFDQENRLFVTIGIAYRLNP